MLDDETNPLKALTSNRHIRTLLLASTLLGFSGDDPEVANLIEELKDLLRAVLLVIDEMIVQVANSL